MSEGPERPQQYCTNCGAELRAGTSFCVSCGTRAAPATPGNPQVISEPVVTTPGSATRNSRRTLFVIGAVGFLLMLLAGGGALALLGSGGEKRPDRAGGQAEEAARASEGLEEPTTPVSATPLQVTTVAEPSSASPESTISESATSSASSAGSEDLTFVDTNGDGGSDYRVYLRYENYLEREDVSSVYMGVAVSRPYETSNLLTYGSDLMTDLLERLPDYDFVILSLYGDYTGNYRGPVTYTDNAEVAKIYEDHLYEHVDEAATAVSENPTERERYERFLRDGVIPLYDYQDYRKILVIGTAADIPPWVYSDREVEVLGEPPGLEKIVDNAIVGHYEAIQAGDFEEAYSDFSSTYQSTEDKATWIEKQKVRRVETIYDSGAEVVSQNTGTGIIRLTFEDDPYPVEITWNMVKEGGEWKLDEQFSSEKDEVPLRTD